MNIKRQEIIRDKLRLIHILEYNKKNKVKLQYLLKIYRLNLHKKSLDLIFLNLCSLINVELLKRNLIALLIWM